MPTIERWRGAEFWLQPVALARNLDFDANELAELLAHVSSRQVLFWRLGMGILAPGADERVRDVRIDADTLTAALMDGRTISVPLAWFLRLPDATPAQRANGELADAGYGLHCPDLDEDLGTEDLLRGAPAAPSREDAA